MLFIFFKLLLFKYQTVYLIITKNKDCAAGFLVIYRKS
jgi:hypothetical protein